MKFSKCRTDNPEINKSRPELALSRLELAELLLKHYPQERSEAIAHLDFVFRSSGT